jgi:polysaccharide chain length determinant protein (PEP-CTERM system associated)
VSDKSIRIKNENNNFTIKDYAEIFWRRKWWFLLPVAFGVSLSTMYSYSLPAVFRSSTLILVEPQKIPESYVHPTVTSSVEERLNTISQQILSRTNLEKIITEYELYKNSDTFNSVPQNSLERIAVKATKMIKGSKDNNTPASTNWNPAEHVDRMRQSIEISLLGGRRQKNAFNISYSGKEPNTVMSVTNALASLFIEENLKVRERQAEGTSAFLSNELGTAERELREVEKSLRNFKEKHNGSLPDQLDANLKSLDRFHLDHQGVSDEIRRLEERKILYEQQISDIENTKYPSATNVNIISHENPLEDQLNDLKLKLSRLKSEFTDNYPDIVILNEQIREIEGRAPENKVNSDVIQPNNNDDGRLKRINDLNGQIKFVVNEINALRDRKIKLSNLINEYERRVEKTYQNEMELFSLTRDYNISKENYENLLAKKLNAKMSENLEKRQQGEQFRVLDPANLPLKPYMPNRAKITLIGSICSGIIGAGLIFLLEYVNPYFRKPEDFQHISDIPLLATIPKLPNKSHWRTYGIISIDDPNSIITEQYRVLFAKLNDINEKHDSKVFAVTSPIRGDGKTLSVLNLAVIMARDFGKKTLLLEGNFKTPALVKFIKQELQSDLVDILLSRNHAHFTSIPFSDTLIPFADDNLSILPAAKSVSNSSGLASSQNMKDLIKILREQYDFILVDSPPILPLSDMNIFEEVVDGVLVVVRAEKTPKNAVITALETIDRDKVVGLILNELKQPLPKYYQYTYNRLNHRNNIKINF